MTNIPISAHTGFQSTRPRGGATRATSPPRGAAPCFNPRAREGRDGIGVVVWPRDFEFQSTRPRGARRVAVLARVATSAVSIHAPARGATLTVSHRSLPPRQFQSTRPRGARLSVMVTPLLLLAFQSARPRGARPTTSTGAATSLIWLAISGHDRALRRKNPYHLR